MTNFEKLKQKISEMDEADLAEWLDDILPCSHESLLRCEFCAVGEHYDQCNDKCERNIRKWLKQEVNENDE